MANGFVVTEQVIGYTAVIFLLSFIVESMVEYLLGTPLDKLAEMFPRLANLKNFKWVLMYVSGGYDAVRSPTAYYF